MIWNLLNCKRNPEPAEFISERLVKAKKEYSCCECSDIIFVGDEYQYTAGKWDSFVTYKTCKTCATIRTKTHGQYEDLFDHVYKFLKFKDAGFIDDMFTDTEILKIGEIFAENAYDEMRIDALWDTY